MILHVDMDAFFAAVEQLDNPQLRGKPVIVGGHSNRGVVTTASYEARKFGVRSAMPMFQARKLCPHGIIVPGRRRRYQQVSHRVMTVLNSVSPLVQPTSIDEAYVDIGGLERLWGSPEQIGRKIKKTVFETVHLTCSVGIAPVKFLAKIASDLEKPDGLTIICPHQALDFAAGLAITRIPGVGRRTAAQLDQFGIKTLGDVRAFSVRALTAKLGKFGRRLHQLAHLQDASQVTPHREAKSISSENTLARDTRDAVVIKRQLLHHAEDVARQLRKAGLRARTIHLKLKLADFKLVTRSKTPAAATWSSRAIYTTACELLSQYRLTQPVRLVGVGTSGLQPAGKPMQADLFESSGQDSRDWEQVDRTVDAIAAKFGRQFIGRASLKK